MSPGSGWALGPLLLLLALLQCAARRKAVVKRSVPDVCATCHVHATCHQIEGKSVCICNYGFVGNGRTHCQDIDECEESGLCGHNAKCVNTEGSYKCYCNDGYKLENGEHSFHPDGNTVSCREIGCGSPPKMKHGYVVGNYSLLPGSAVHYECKEGFYSNEGKFSYCTANETWEPATLSCKGVDCGIPPSVLNAHPASVSGTTYGSEVTYNCVHGYFMASGNQTAVCNAKGQWDGTDLVCKEIDCGKPLLIPHTEMTWDNSTTLRSRVYYQCKEGYYSNGGRNFSECTIDQSWENITFVCKEEELFSNLSIFNETCVKWERKTGRLGVQKTYTFHILGQRWDEKMFSEDVIFNITTNEDNPKVCLDLDSGSNYVVNITTISSTDIPVSVILAVQTKVKEAFNNVLIFNDTCLKWQRNVRGTDVEDRYSFHVQGQRWYQKEFFHEMIFDLTTHKQAPEVCFDLQPGTNYSVNISMAALNFSLLVSITTQITDPPFPAVEFVSVTGSAPLLRLRKAEDQNGPVSFYQVIVLPLDLQSTFICDSFAAATFFSNTTDVKGYVAAEFLAKDVADNMPVSLGDRHYYGKFYNAPLKLGEEYCVFLRVISEWNKLLSPQHSELPTCCFSLRSCVFICHSGHITNGDYIVIPRD
ncbi:sushi domain-containing protein 1 isoform X4 [Pezoporus flaviventris]|uniref:sushi domain-containing protein 1 isoform X4 n=1 Tax=Pezoporus flaviventris TaxID=889875 RepID=UPI002AB12C2E|nr:sushi domain-containing protein 1 isoform X4 [Pezoporus flaviventris]